MLQKKSSIGRGKTRRVRPDNGLISANFSGSGSKTESAQAVGKEIPYLVRVQVNYRCDNRSPVGLLNALFEIFF